MGACSRRNAVVGVAVVLAAACVQAGQPPNEKESPAQKIRKVLDEPITLEVSGFDLAELAGQLKAKTGLNFIVDPRLASNNYPPAAGTRPPRYMVKAERAKLRQALQQSLGKYGFTHVVLENSVAITTEDNAASLQLAQFTDVRFEEVPIREALKAFRRTVPFNVVLDPHVAKESEKPISVDLEKTSVETAVRLMAEQVGLKVVRMENALFLTSTTRAEKMHLEEKERKTTVPNAYTTPPPYYPPAPRFTPAPAMPLPPPGLMPPQVPQAFPPPTDDPLATPNGH